MMTGTAHGAVAPLSAAIPVLIFCIAVLSLPLASAERLGLTPAETANWIVGLYAIPALLSLVLTVRTREPVLLAWHTSSVAFLR